MAEYSEFVDVSGSSSASALIIPHGFSLRTGEVFRDSTGDKGAFCYSPVDKMYTFMTESEIDFARDMYKFISHKGVPTLHNGVPSKHYCHLCSCRVATDGHGARCVVRNSNYSSFMRRMAWAGDTLHAADVRLFLLSTGVDDKNLQLEAEKLVSAQAQADFFDSVSDPVYKSVSQSVHSKSQAFEANYFGDFRRSYIVNNLSQALSGSDAKFEVTLGLFSFLKQPSLFDVMSSKPLD